jgi:multidrug resistance efflux pump
MKLGRLILIIGGLVVVAVLLFVGTGWLSHSSDRTSDPTPEVEDTPAEIGVRARGEVVPVVWAELSFSTAGSMAEWLVAEGDVVEAGTPLGQLDAGMLELALQEARAALETAELELTQAQTEHRRQLAEAGLALQIAEDRLAQARARFPSLTATEVTLQQAIQAEADAAYEYEKAVNRPWEWRFEEVQKAYTKAWQDAKDGLAVAQAEHDAAVAEQYASSQELAILEAEVQRARLELERLQEGEDPLLGREVEEARLRVVRAQAELETSTLVAPFDGTVVALELQPQDWAQPGVPAAALADLSALRIETTDLDEWGAAQIEVGSEAEIVFNAFDDKTLTGHVSEIALRGDRLPAGDVVYRVIVELDAPDPDLRWGMTVRITFPIEE